MTYLAHPEIVAWLGGIVPTWTHLERQSYLALLRQPDDPDRAYRIARDLTAKETSQSPFIRNTLTLLRLADPEGIKLTATGNLSRAAVATLADTCPWPTYDIEVVRSVSKVINAQDVVPLDLMHRVTFSIGLFKRKKGRLFLSERGRSALDTEGPGDLLADLVETCMWRVDLASFDGLPLPTWPQTGFGLTLWCLSHAAKDWETPARLVRLTTKTDRFAFRGPHDMGAAIMEHRVLRVLAYFGLMEAKITDSSRPLTPKRSYRKSPLFDRVLTFMARVEMNAGRAH